MGLRNWYRNRIKNSKVGREIANEQWIKAYLALKNTLLIVDVDGACIDGVKLKVPKGKTGILIRGSNTLVKDCIITHGKSGIEIVDTGSNNTVIK